MVKMKVKEFATGKMDDLFYTELQIQDYLLDFNTFKLNKKETFKNSEL